MDRAEHTTDETPASDDEADVPALITEAPPANPPGSLRHDVPKPGNVQDAFPLGDEPKAKPNRNAIAEP